MKIERMLAQANSILARAIEERDYEVQSRIFGLINILKTEYIAKLEKDIAKLRFENKPLFTSRYRTNTTKKLSYKKGDN